ncbi:hypothetical protein [Carboxylicivirga linearis]|uniref:Uncharacterized protein n=1 Tax=Carboxylicivirga linearis TaxID=1628157 RepID=A0ABS5JU65_9BACT|nr:hypothetical protein [Carboxylicivirga linearis]MBS2098064.1 hypothetical protein [Carboxylicivirga linearis]
MSNKPRIIKDYKKLDDAIKEQIKLTYPYGFSENLIRFSYKDGQMISALPFETDDSYFLVKMSTVEAEQIIEDDDDYNDDGNLKSSAKEDYSEKYADVDYMKEVIEEDDMEDD